MKLSLPNTPILFKIPMQCFCLGQQTLFDTAFRFLPGNESFITLKIKDEIKRTHSVIHNQEGQRCLIMRYEGSATGFLIESPLQNVQNQSIKSAIYSRQEVYVHVVTYCNKTIMSKIEYHNN